MNKIHNVIWSKAQNAWVVVAEGTKAVSKAGGAGLKIMIALIMLTPITGHSATLPLGGTVTVGQGAIVSNGPNQLIIKQTNDKLGINWQSFNVGADGHVVFEQPSVHSVALNRVIGSDGSAILGKIDANGQIVLINPNGVIFGKDSKVNVGGLIASTLDITDEDFKSGNYNLLAGSNNGEVVNNGTLQSAEGGYIALIGKSVKNNGLIKAQLGTAALAAGDAVTLDFSGDGLINVQVKKSTLKALVDNQGAIQADGGSVLMTARATNALTDTVVNNDGIIQAQTINSKYGKIFLDGGSHDGEGTLLVNGKLDASAPLVGSGGLIETSAKNVEVKNSAIITTGSREGRYGNWLIDPTDFTVGSGTGELTTSTIGAATLSTALQSSNVTLQTDSAGSNAGNINVNGSVSWSANTTLTLNANNLVLLNGSLSASGDSAKLVVNGGSNPFRFGNSLSITGANSSLTVNGAAWTLLRNASDLESLHSAPTSQNILLMANLDAKGSSAWNGGLGYQPLGTSDHPFTGSVYGFGRRITGLSINRPNEDYVGLIGNASGGVFYSINLAEASIVGKNYTGALIGKLESGSISSVSLNSAKVDGSSDVGGIAGHATSLSNSSNSGYLYMVSAAVSDTVSNSSVNGIDRVGGMFGTLGIESNQAGSILNLTNTSVTGAGDKVGGLAGFLNAAGRGNYSSMNFQGTVSGVNYVGGMIGYSGSSSITTSAVNATVNASGNFVGGFAGYLNDNAKNLAVIGSVNGATNVGGVVGQLTGILSSSLSAASVTATATSNSSAGGLVGYMSGGSITDVSSMGNVAATGGGGLVGRTTGGSILRAVSSGSAENGLIGTKSGAGSITEAYWNEDVSGTDLSAGGVGLSDAQFKSSSTYSGWSNNIDYTGTVSQTGWRMYDGLSGPLLKFLMPTVSLKGAFSGSYQAADFTIQSIANGIRNGSQQNPNGITAISSTDGLQSTGLNGITVRDAGTYGLGTLYSSQFGWNILDSANSTKSITVAKKVLATTISGTTKIYDGTSASNFVVGISGLYSGDEVSVTTDGNYSSKDAGLSKTITYNTSLTGLDAKNYALPTPYGTISGSIAKRTLNIVGLAEDRDYDGTTLATTTFSDDRVGGDSLELSGASEFIDKNAGMSKNVNISSINVTGSDSSNYIWNTSITTTANISKKLLGLTVDGNKTYDGTAHVLDGQIKIDGIIGSEAVQLDAPNAMYSSKNAGSYLTINYGVVGLKGIDATNYKLDSNLTSGNADYKGASINQRAIDLILSGKDKVYDGTTVAGISITGAGLIGDDVSIGYESSAFTDKNVGLVKTIDVGGVILSGEDAANYKVASNLKTNASITKAVLSVSAMASDKVYDGSAAASSNLTDNRVTGDNLTVEASESRFSDKNAAFEKTVDVSGITVSGVDAENYTWNASTTALANITKAVLAVSAVAADKTYDGTSAATAALSDNRIAGDNLTITSTSAFTDKNAGSSKAVSVSGIDVTGADVGNYTWNANASSTAKINKANLVVSANAADKVYDGSTAAHTALADNRLSGDVLILTSASSSFADKNAGAGKAVSVSGISVSGSDAGNYTWNSTAVSAADISKARLAITAMGVSKDYDNTTSADVNLGFTPLGSDALSVTARASFADKNVGIGKLVSVDGINVTGADASNYEWSASTTTQADISRYVSAVTMNDTGKIYDGTVDGNADFSYLNFGDQVNLSIKLKYSNKNAGSNLTAMVVNVAATGADAGNYEFLLDRTVVNAEIDKRFIDVSASGHDKVYDGGTTAKVDLAGNALQIDAAGFDTSVNTGVVAGDNLHIAGNANFSDKNAGEGKIVTVTGLSLSGADANNYSIWPDAQPVQTTASVSKAALTISAIANDKVYDGSTGAITQLTDNRVAGDGLTVVSSGSTFSDRNAGAGKVVTIGGITLSGADAGNYIANTGTQTTANIGKAVLVIGAKASDKAYDGSSLATAILSDNRVSGDVLGVSYEAAMFSDKNAGADKAVTVNNIVVAGDDAGNYTWNSEVLTKATISKANLVISALASDKTYDGTTNATVSLTDNRISNDNLSVTVGNTAFEDKNAGANRAVTASGINVAGADSGNYSWNSVATSAAEISKAYLNISAKAQNKAYDARKLATVAFSDNRITGDDLKIAAQNSTFDDKRVGVGKAVTSTGIGVTGADAGNYTFSNTVTSHADIAKAALVVKAQSTGKIAGAADSTLMWSIYDGQVYAGDTITGNVARGAGEAAGIYTIDKGNLTAGSNYDLTVIPATFNITRNTNLEQAQNTVSAITTVTKAPAPTESESLSSERAQSTSATGDYRLLNLGMKLPENMATYGENASK